MTWGESDLAELAARVKREREFANAAGIFGYQVVWTEVVPAVLSVAVELGWRVERPHPYESTCPGCRFEAEYGSREVPHPVHPSAHSCVPYDGSADDDTAISDRDLTRIIHEQGRRFGLPPDWLRHPPQEQGLVLLALFRAVVDAARQNSAPAGGEKPGTTPEDVVRGPSPWVSTVDGEPMHPDGSEHWARGVAMRTEAVIDARAWAEWKRSRNVRTFARPLPGGAFQVLVSSVDGPVEVEVEDPELAAALRAAMVAYDAEVENRRRK